MVRTLSYCSILLILWGCDRPTDQPLAPVGSSPAQVLIIQSFGNADTVRVGPSGYRVGMYFDFKKYDSLRINFSATRLAPSSSYNHIQIKIGPAYYLYDSLQAEQTDFSLSVKLSDVKKAQLAAFTFTVPDNDAPLFLARLRVFGWTTQ